MSETRAKTATQIDRRERAMELLDTLTKRWESDKEVFDELTRLIAIPGVDTKRVFFVLGVESNDLDTPVAHLKRWAEYRLTQLEALEALSDVQKDALSVDMQKVVQSAAH